MRHELENPLLPVEFNLQVAIGAVEFRDETIKNLRQQLLNLRMGLMAAGIDIPLIDELQYHHLRGENENLQPIS